MQAITDKRSTALVNLFTTEIYIASFRPSCSICESVKTLIPQWAIIFVSWLSKMVRHV